MTYDLKNAMREWKFDGLKIIVSQNQNKIFREFKEIFIFEKEKITFHKEKTFSEKNTYFIDDSTLLSEILNFTKNNVLYRHYFDLFLGTKIANDDIVSDLQKIINEQKDDELIEVKTDLNKLFSLFFNIENRFITKNDLYRFAKISSSQAFKPLLILNNVSFVDNDLLKLLAATFEIILIVSDVRDYVMLFNSFESIVINNGESLIEILDENNFKGYVENKINEFISEDEWKSFMLKEDSEKNQKIMTKICFFS